MRLLHKVAHADSYSRNQNSLGVMFTTEGQDWFLEKINNLEIKPKGPDKILMGRHLMEMGVKPGKEMGRVIEDVFQMQLDGLVTNLDQAVEAARLLLTGEDFALAQTS
jgi:tRNA nucleotidyltransferase (CCA-adding enzyme)